MKSLSLGETAMIVPESSRSSRVIVQSCRFSFLMFHLVLVTGGISQNQSALPSFVQWEGAARRETVFLVPSARDKIDNSWNRFAYATFFPSGDKKGRTASPSTFSSPLTRSRTTNSGDASLYRMNASVPPSSESDPAAATLES